MTFKKVTMSLLSCNMFSSHKFTSLLSILCLSSPYFLINVQLALLLQEGWYVVSLVCGFAFRTRNNVEKKTNHQY